MSCAQAAGLQKSWAKAGSSTHGCQPSVVLTLTRGTVPLRQLVWMGFVSHPQLLYTNVICNNNGLRA